MKRMFPYHFTYEGVTITLYADGTCHGDPRMLELTLASIFADRHPSPAGMHEAIVMWLLLRAMQDEKRIGRAPR